MNWNKHQEEKHLTGSSTYYLLAHQDRVIRGCVFGLTGLVASNGTTGYPFPY